MKKTQGKNGGTLSNAEKGDVLNPNGRPKGSRNSKTILKELLSIEIEQINPLTKEKEKLTVGEMMQLKMISLVLNGKTKENNVIAAYNAILDRAENKPSQAVTGGTDNDGNDVPLIVQTKTVVEFGGLTQKLWEYGQKQNEKDK